MNNPQESVNVFEELRKEMEGTQLGAVMTGAPAPAVQSVTVKTITVSKTFNLGNYQSARMEAECGIPETDVQNRATLSEYYGQVLAALDEAFRLKLQKPQQ